MTGLTDRQRQVLTFITDWVRHRGYQPSYREIGAHLGIRSTNAIGDHLRALRKKGFVAKRNSFGRGSGRARSLAVIRQEVAPGPTYVAVLEDAKRLTRNERIRLMSVLSNDLLNEEHVP